MSATVYVVGFKPPNDKWRAMKAAYDACHAAGVDVPKDVMTYFRNCAPDDCGVRESLEDHPSCSKYSAEMIEGIDVDVTKLPKDVTIVRFYVSY